MPRNASGTYTLPSGNPVSSGTLIDATWANNTLNDIANEVTDSLSRSGEGGMLAPFRLNDGVQATPGLAFTNEPSTGMYRAGTNEAWLVAGGTQVLQFTTTGAATRFAPGAVTTPSITALGDVNTGLWFPAADTIAASTGGVEALRVLSTGNVGIGTTNPTNTAGFSRQLQIEGATAALTLSGTTGTGKYTLGVPGANAVGLWDNTASAYRWYVDSSGNLGIGTASPAFALGSGLEVERAGVATLRLENSSGANGIEIAADLTTNGIRFYGLNNAPFVFSPNATERMRLDSSGSLGLGVTPSAWNSGAKAFQLNATPAFWSFSNNLYLSNNRFFDTGGTNKYIANGFATTYEQSSGQHIWLTAPSGTAGNAISFTQAMTLDASGNLGVGTASPTYKIEVLLAAGSGNIARFGQTGVSNGYTITTNGSVLTHEWATAGSVSMKIDANANIVAGASVALATTATNGFLYVPTCAGTPTGVPTSITGMAPIVVNTTNNKLYFYSGGAWRDAGP